MRDHRSPKPRLPVDGTSVSGWNQSATHSRRDAAPACRQNGGFEQTRAKDKKRRKDRRSCENPRLLARELADRRTVARFCEVEQRKTDDGRYAKNDGNRGEDIGHHEAARRPACPILRVEEIHLYVR